MARSSLISIIEEGVPFWFSDGAHSILGSLSLMIALPPAPMLNRRRLGRDLRIEGLGASQSFGDVGADILAAHVLLELGLMHQPGGLLACAAQQQSTPARVDAVGKPFQRVETGGVDG